MPSPGDDSFLARDNVVGCGSFEFVRNCCSWCKTSSTTPFVSNWICHVRKSCSTEERRTAVLFGSMMVICVYAPDSAKDFEEYEKFTQRLTTKVMLEGRKGRARRLIIAGGLVVGLRFYCMDEDEEMKEIYGPKRWNGIDADARGLKKTMWLEVMNEFNCKALSTWSSGDHRKEEAFTHKGLG